MVNTSYKICPECGAYMLCLPKGGCQGEKGFCFLSYIWLCTKCGKEIPLKEGKKDDN